MSWVQTGVSSQSLLRKTVAIGAILLQSAVYRVGSSLLLAVAFLSGGMVTFLFFALCAYLLEKYLGQFEVMSSIVAILLFAAAIGVWLLLGWQVAKWRTRTETNKWHALRSLKLGHPEYHAWLQRARKWSLLVPSAITLAILLFYPETYAITTHIFKPHAAQLHQYRMQIPITWPIISSTEDNGSDFSFVALWTSRGLARNWHFEPFISSATFRTAPVREKYNGVELPQHATILSTNTRAIAGTPSTCLEYLYPMHYTPPEDYRLIECATADGGFKAWFAGQRQDISDFYKMLDSVKKAK